MRSESDGTTEVIDDDEPILYAGNPSGGTWVVHRTTIKA
jgi:hypothetical protein